MGYLAHRFIVISCIFYGKLIVFTNYVVFCFLNIDIMLVDFI